MGHYRLLLGQPCQVNFRQQPRNFIHRHTFFEPCLVVAGSGEFTHGQQVFALQPGDLFIADPGVDHEITSLKTRDLELLFTAFVVTEVSHAPPAAAGEDRLIRHFLLRHEVWRAGQSQLVEYLAWLRGLTRVTGLRSRQFLLDEAMRVAVLQIMSALTLDAPSELPGDQTDQRTLRRVLRAIDAHLHEPVYVETIAQASGMSQRSLRRLCQQQLKRTVTAEIQERKMQRAAALLALPEFNVAEASRQVGIEDQAQFSRLFKRVIGLSPSAYRQAKIPRAGRKSMFVQIGGVAMKTEFRDVPARRVTGRGAR